MAIAVVGKYKGGNVKGTAITLKFCGSFAIQPIKATKLFIYPPH